MTIISESKLILETNSILYAKSVDTPLAWREFRNQRNLVNRLKLSNKNNYYKSHLNLDDNDKESDSHNDSDSHTSANNDSNHESSHYTDKQI